MMCSGAVSLNGCGDCEKPSKAMIPAISFIDAGSEKCPCNKPGRPSGRPTKSFFSFENDADGEKCPCNKPPRK